jgi:hypothetical protein
MYTFLHADSSTAIRPPGPNYYGSPGCTETYEDVMKKVISLLTVTYLLSACLGTGSSLPHDDSVAAAPRDAGPTLCHDGTVPPCTPRD